MNLNFDRLKSVHLREPSIQAIIKSIVQSPSLREGAPTPPTMRFFTGCLLIALVAAQGGVPHRPAHGDATTYVHQSVTSPGDHCLEITIPGGAVSPFWQRPGNTVHQTDLSGKLERATTASGTKSIRPMITTMATPLQRTPLMLPSHSTSMASRRIHQHQHLSQRRYRRPRRCSKLPGFAMQHRSMLRSPRQRPTS